MARNGMSWWKIGCLGVIVIPLMLIVVFAVLMYLGAGSPEFSEQVLVQQIPTSESSAEERMGDGSERAAVSGPGTVSLDLSGVELYVKAAPEGTPIRVQAEYDDAHGELSETFEPGNGEGWQYDLKYRAAEDSFLGYMSSMFNNDYPQFAILLPRGTPLALKLTLRQGGGLVDLGGMTLTTVDITLMQGGLEFEVSKPLTQPLRRFTSNGNMGGIEISSLGNASPEVVRVKQRMGGFELDLRGDWQQDSDVTVSVDMGGGAVRIPDDVNVVGVATPARGPAVEVDADAPTLNITTRANMGEIEVLR